MRSLSNRQCVTANAARMTMARVISAIRPRMPLASSRPRRSATAVELSLGFAINLRRRAVIARACIIPAIVATTRTPASTAAASMVLDHDDGGPATDRTEECHLRRLVEDTSRRFGDDGQADHAAHPDGRGDQLDGYQRCTCRQQLASPLSVMPSF